jgi:cytochrome oxidase assembly protein ShyY1
MWQLDRARQKQQLLAAFAAAASEPATDFARTREVTDPQRYPHVLVSGTFISDRSYLLDEQVRAGRLGVHAIAVVAVAGEDDLLLVDRGWIAWSHAPGTAPVLPAPPSGKVELTGIYAPFPGGGLRVGGNALTAQDTWPKLTLHVDAAEISADLGKAVLPRMLLLDADSGSGFVREWTPNVMPPVRHRAYALQWFTFALAALAIFLILHWRKVQK